jgi:hypothetical protein
MVSEHLNGITVRAQTHDSITFNINYRHPKWQDGFAGILESFSRPCVIRDEVFSLGWEADAGIYWADPKGVGIKSVLDLEQYINYRLLPPTKRQYLLNDALPEIA